MRLLDFLVVAQAFLLQVAFGNYVFDSGCSENEKGFIRRQMVLAQSHISAGVQLLDDARLHPSTQIGIPVIWNLFGIRAPANLQGPAMDEWSQGLALVRQHLAGAQFHKDESPTPNMNPAGTRKDVKIYCTTDRLTKRDNEDFYRDTDPDVQHVITNENPYGLDHNNLKDNKPPIFAWTATEASYNAGNTEDDINYSIKFDQIQINPWYLNFVMNELHEKTAVAPSKWYVKRALQFHLDEWASKTLFSWIDNEDQFAKTLVHEMMHTTAGRSAADVDDRFGHLKSYGWINAMNIAKRDLSLNGPKGPGPNNNADSLALFALCAYKRVNGVIVKKDGNAAFPFEHYDEFANN